MVQWLSTFDCTPPHAVTHPDKVDQLAGEFLLLGWDTSRPALIGYVLDDTVQLLSGSHRHAAAVLAGIRLPVVVVTRDVVAEAWGHLPRWHQLMELGETRYEHFWHR